VFVTRLSDKIEAMTQRASEWQVRSFRSADQKACNALYGDGLIGGKIADNDSALDLDDIQSVYMSEGNHFWVAENRQGKIVGMVGVQHYPEEAAGLVRRLRVAKDHLRRGIGTGLVETALKFCQENQYLKVILDTYMDREPAIELFKKFRFKLERVRKLVHRDVMYFYADLYEGSARPSK
jgi:ribosomal protein S18 acetylase RimI-like enzyme